MVVEVVAVTVVKKDILPKSALNQRKVPVVATTVGRKDTSHANVPTLKSLRAHVGHAMRKATSPVNVPRMKVGNDQACLPNRSFMETNALADALPCKVHQIGCMVNQP